MHPFASYILKNYYRQTGWNEDNLYSNLTRSSTAILDFNVPRGLHINISKSPNALFKTTYSMNALPTLNGSVGYIFTSCEVNIPSSQDVRFKDTIERFKVFDQPRRPEPRDEVWQQGRRVDARDFLLYGRIYVPTGRLDALYATRLSPTLQLLIAAISDPRSPTPLSQATSRKRGDASGGMSNVMLNLQHDVGRWCTEYSWSADDGMFGLRVLHNFGSSRRADPAVGVGAPRPKRVDEEEAMEGGLRGRFSAGAELYFSAKEKSAGLSTGVRFTTVPDATPPSFQLAPGTFSPSAASTLAPLSVQSQTPTTLTAVFNPMMGHISGAYAARVSRDLSVCSRFDFNVYSYLSEWTMGAEWWIGGGAGNGTEPPLTGHENGGRARFENHNGVFKARMSTNADVSLMWEGRLKNVLVSLGVVSDLTNRSKPIRAMGLELAYFSSS
ncbi:mitochondrial distribution and morphology protein 10 [Exidia glandulosa HHB12029]|uniref:Mitochondrial distribution and morphology protein 10 n=1 Tax=Exidia glandulosa HHB12029 TaxID=1314781 RepID=A0A165QTA9_EXIGL|nr:mitochondrial distribution and morphology protein 10 [Exidia glandulosa HHB12029]